MKVLKFGGTSVGSSHAIREVLAIIQDEVNAGHQPIIVLSAMGGVTNTLTQLAKDAAQGLPYEAGLKDIENKHFEVIKALIPLKQQNPVLTTTKLMLNELEDMLQGVQNLQELSAQSLDHIVSYGERLSTYLVSQAALMDHPQALFVDARPLIKTDNQFGHAQVQMAKTYALIQTFAASHAERLWFVTGFIASNEAGRTTTLGRGGSDYTAALFGAALEASAIEIWTDVNGMLTADPRMVKKAFSLPLLSYTEAMELSYFGAKVIYPPTMIPAFEKKLPIRIRNTFDRSFPGTLISHQIEACPYPIKGISSISDISLVNLIGSGMVGQSGFSGRLFTLLAREQINVVLITQSSSEHSITFAVHPDDLLRAKHFIEKEFELELLAGKLMAPELEQQLSVLAIVGENMKQTPGMSGKLFHALGRNGINVRAIAQGSSEYNISVIIEKKDLAKGLNAVHDAFFAQLKKTLHVFSLGTGNIGKTLFRQLRQQHEFLLEHNDIEIKVIGVSNSRMQLIDEEGLDLEHWEESLQQNGQKASLPDFIRQMIQLNLPNCVLIDNTASPLPTQYYLDAFAANISVVTCNKIANSGSYAFYKALKQTARKYGVDYFYETNVGAGLPIVRVLKDLMLSGDRILRIEAILSGTISYIFNHFEGEKSFHDIVQQAQALGYTEPDPRDDLKGTDFMRKMLILARDAGFALEPEEVDLGAILPENCLAAPDVPQFYQELQNANKHFENLKAEAAKQNRVIRYIGVLEDGKVRIGLEMVDASHPFYALSGSDNIISFTTERYKERPLVVKGPGAGAEVTAAGVFADLVNIGASF
jgi:aspartokinase/homoserine dehydrogenase 1